MIIRLEDIYLDQEENNTDFCICWAPSNSTEFIDIWIGSNSKEDVEYGVKELMNIIQYEKTTSGHQFRYRRPVYFFVGLKDKFINSIDWEKIND